MFDFVQGFVRRWLGGGEAAKSPTGQPSPRGGGDSDGGFEPLEAVGKGDSDAESDDRGLPALAAPAAGLRPAAVARSPSGGKSSRSANESVGISATESPVVGDATLLSADDIRMEEDASSPPAPTLQPLSTLALSDGCRFLGVAPLPPNVEAFAGLLAKRHPPYSDPRRHFQGLVERDAAGLRAEFLDLGQFDAVLEHVPELWTAAALQCNRRRNRYCDILPNEPTRFRLEGQSGEGADYINCNAIDGPWLGVPHSYLCGQAPTEHTLGHWWHMVWQSETTLILMLAKLVEKGCVKADRYWPKKEGTTAKFGGYAVRMVEESPVPGHDEITRRVLQVQSPEGQSRTVTQYQYSGWPDHGVPADSHGFVQLLELTDAHLAAPAAAAGEADAGAEGPAVGAGGPGPVLVHCSAGVGRTGVFITAHVVLTRLALHLRTGTAEPFQYNLVQTVCQLRWGRSHLIQTLDQYAFCYSVIASQAEQMVA
eukprot:EG_transcript_11123